MLQWSFLVDIFRNFNQIDAYISKRRGKKASVPSELMLLLKEGLIVL